jgi:hypothetical protein
MDESDLQNKKHFEQRISTFRGITIDFRDENENAFDLIRVKCEFDSNVIDESDFQYEKQFDSRMSTLFEIKINCSRYRNMFPVS